MTLPSHIHYRVGIDGGGSSTRARLTLLDGTVLGEGKAGASGLMQGVAQAWRNIQYAIDRAVHASPLDRQPPPNLHNCALGIGIAGFNHSTWRAAFLDANPGYTTLAADTDAYTALLGAHRGQPGALVIAGTGTVALALFADGTRSAAGGWGFPSGDEGGGAVLGLRAVNLAQRAADGRRAPSPLTRAVHQAIGRSDNALLAWCCEASQSDFARLAPLVFDCETQDPAAAQLLLDAVRDIERLALAVDRDNALPLVVRGSIGQRLCERLSPFHQACLVTPKGDALDGALQLDFSPRSPV